MGAVVVVEVDEGVEQGLQLGQGGGLVGVGAQQLTGLVDPNAKAQADVVLERVGPAAISPTTPDLVGASSVAGW